MSARGWCWAVSPPSVRPRCGRAAARFRGQRSPQPAWVPWKGARPEQPAARQQHPRAPKSKPGAADPCASRRRAQHSRTLGTAATGIGHGTPQQCWLPAPQPARGRGRAHIRPIFSSLTSSGRKISLWSKPPSGEARTLPAVPSLQQRPAAGTSQRLPTSPAYTKKPQGFSRSLLLAVAAIRLRDVKMLLMNRPHANIPGLNHTLSRALAFKQRAGCFPVTASRPSPHRTGTAVPEHHALAMPDGLQHHGSSKPRGPRRNLPRHTRLSGTPFRNPGLLFSTTAHQNPNICRELHHLSSAIE